jgi:aldehyde dehydrogenase (NAD(P)+)
MDGPARQPDALDTHDLDEALAKLDGAKQTWAKLPVREKIAHLRGLVERTHTHAHEWVAEAAKAKGIEGTPLVGEEWVSGPWAHMATLNATIQTLSAIADGKDPTKGFKIHDRGEDQIAVQVYPGDIFESLLMSGTKAEVWQQPGVTRDNLRDNVGHFFRQPDHDGEIALVLGAGNIAAIPPLDVIYELAAEGRVAICKLNPVNAYLGPIFEKIYAPLIEAGFVKWVYGGTDVGAYLVEHDLVDKVHITGSVRSHDIIVYGPGEEGEKRREARDPKLKKPITSELGGVGPTLVVPGPWSAADMQHQAEHIATQKLHNGGFNCIAMQVLVTHKEWEHHDAFLETVSETIENLPYRPAYYPGAEDRIGRGINAHDEHQKLGGKIPRVRLKGIEADDDAYSFNQEFFSSMWAETALSAKDEADFLDKAVDFANERTFGTLGCQILIHPATRKKLGQRFEDALARLRYGTIGVNAWSGVGFLLARGAWGAFPGHPLHDAQSGIGVVHNSLLFDKPQKTVIRAPFAPFPRSALLGEAHFEPKPFYYVTHKTADRVGELLVHFEADKSFLKLPGLFAAALRG